MVEYKAERAGKTVLRIGRFEPSSKLCSSCGSINRELKLSDRVWTCAGCGVEHDRDVNAAINIKLIASCQKNKSIPPEGRESTLGKITH